MFGDIAIQGNIADLLPTAVKCTAIHISPPCSPFHTAGPGHIIKITAAFERAHNIKTETFIENIGIDIAVKTGVGIADNHFIVRRVGESAGTVQFDEHLASGSRVDTCRPHDFQGGSRFALFILCQRSRSLTGWSHVIVQFILTFQGITDFQDTVFIGGTVHPQLPPYVIPLNDKPVDRKFEAFVFHLPDVLFTTDHPGRRSDTGIQH